MSWKTEIAQRIPVESFGWTFVHSIWEILAVAILLWIALKLIRRDAANARYALSIAALIFCLFIPLVTFLQLYGETSGSGHISYSDRGSKEIRSEDPELLDARGSSPQLRTGPVSSDMSKPFDSLISARDYFADQLPQTFPFLLAIWVAGTLIFSLRLTG